MKIFKIIFLFVLLSVALPVIAACDDKALGQSRSL